MKRPRATYLNPEDLPAPMRDELEEMHRAKWFVRELRPPSLDLLVHVDPPAPSGVPPSTVSLGGREVLLERTIASGGHGCVYAAGNQVVKFFFETAPGELPDTFLKEMQAGILAPAHAAHWACVPIRDDSACLLFPRAQCTLFEWAQQRTRSYEQVRQAVSQTLRRAAELHRCGIMHGDIKPQNLLVDGGNVRFCDMGSSQPIARHGPLPREHCCTINFRAPEMYDEGYDETADTFSIGCTAVALALAPVLYFGRDHDGSEQGKRTLKQETLLLVGNGQGPDVVERVRRLWARDAPERFDEFAAHEEFADFLRVALGSPRPAAEALLGHAFVLPEEPLETEPAAAAPPPAQPRRRKHLAHPGFVPRARDAPTRPTCAEDAEAFAFQVLKSKQRITYWTLMLGSQLARYAERPEAAFVSVTHFTEELPMTFRDTQAPRLEDAQRRLVWDVRGDTVGAELVRAIEAVVPFSLHTVPPQLARRPCAVEPAPAWALLLLLCDAWSAEAHAECMAGRPPACLERLRALRVIGNMLEALAPRAEPPSPPVAAKRMSCDTVCSEAEEK